MSLKHRQKLPYSLRYRPKIKMIKQILYSILLCSLSFNTFATQTTAAKIRAAVTTFVRNNVELSKDQHISIQTSNIDPRTNFQQCKTFRYYLPAGSVKRNTTVLVTCKESTNFRLYVPVQVQWLIPIVTMSVTGDNGDLLNQSNMQISYLNQNRIYGSYYKQISELLGAKLRRRVGIGRPLTRYDICMVCRGDSVKIVAKKQGLYLSTTGTALTDGIIGDTIRVRNNHSKRIIHAIISAVGQVTVHM